MLSERHPAFGLADLPGRGAGSDDPPDDLAFVGDL